MSYECIFTPDLAAVRRWLNSAVIWRGRPARVFIRGKHAVRMVIAFVATGMLMVTSRYRAPLPPALFDHLAAATLAQPSVVS
jgi:hypothetical protein